MVVPGAIPDPVTVCPTINPVADPTVIVLPVNVPVPDTFPEFGSDIVSTVPAIADIVAPFAIPIPIIDMPTTKPVADPTVTVVDPEDPLIDVVGTIAEIGVAVAILLMIRLAYPFVPISVPVIVAFEDPMN